MTLKDVCVATMFLFATVVSGVADADLAPLTQIAATANDYDGFMTLSLDQRRARFDALSAEAKAGIIRTHAERWLESNRGRLTASEAAVFDEIVAFITPEIYRQLP